MDLQYFKERVSIITLVETLGYSYNRSKGRHPKQYEHPNGDKVIISDKLNPNMEVYFTRNNYDDNGTVVDFVKNRLSMFNVHYNSEWEGVLKVLSEYAGQPFQQLKPNAKSSYEKDDAPRRFIKDDFIIKKPTLQDLTYLRYDRSLSKEALNTFLSFIRTVQAKRQRIINIGFPYFIPRHGKQNEKEELAGFEVVNHSFKGHAKGSQRKEAVWMASLAPAPQLVKDVYFAESAIDAMSFYQLYKQKFNFEHAVFISTGGNVLKSQAKQVLIVFPNAKIHTLFDNDFSGKMYDIYLASIKANREVVMRKNNDSVSFEMKKGIFEIPIDQLSLARFERATGIRSGIRVHKAKGKDFNEMLQHRNQESRNTKTGLRR